MQARDEVMPDPGRRLREIRERLGLKYRDVQEASHLIARARGNQEFAMGLSRLADIENQGTVPSIFRMYSLSAVYGLGFHTVLAWYGVNLAKLPADTARIDHIRTRIVELDAAESCASSKPAAASDPALRKTLFIGRESAQSPFPGILAKLHPGRRYALIGTDDWSMYPLIHPGAFAQIDEKRRRPENGPWTSDADRPIYLVERRQGYSCAWCSLRHNKLFLQYHPASGLDPELLSTPDDGEIVGQVIGVAMRLDSAKRHRIRF